MPTIRCFFAQDMLMPPPSPARDETQDDSGFHSGGMSSSTSTEHEQMQGGKTKKKSIMKSSKGTKRSESQPGRMNRCESIDLKEKQKGGSSDHQFRTRSKLISEQQAGHYGGHYPHMAPIYAVHPQVGSKIKSQSDGSLAGPPCRPHLGGTRPAATCRCRRQEKQLLDGKLHLSPRSSHPLLPP